MTTIIGISLASSSFLELLKRFIGHLKSFWGAFVSGSEAAAGAAGAAAGEKWGPFNSAPHLFNCVKGVCGMVVYCEGVYMEWGFGLGLEYDLGRLWFGGPYRKVTLAFNRCVGCKVWVRYLNVWFDKLAVEEIPKSLWRDLGVFWKLILLESW